MNPETRSLPFSEDSEKAVLCSILLNPYEASATAGHLISAETFYIPAHRLIYDAICGLLEKKRPVDFVTLKKTLCDQGILEEVGGKEALSSLFNFVPDWIGIEHYAKIVYEKAVLRHAIKGAEELTKACYDPSLEFLDVINLVEQLMTSVARSKPGIEQSFKDLLLDWIADLETRSERIRKSGVGFGIPRLDQEIGALQPGEICVIGAKTSGGKTALAMSAVDYSTFDKGLPVRIFSLEMTRMQLCDRMASKRAKVSMKSFRTGAFKECEFPRITKYVDQVARSSVLISQEHPMDISKLSSIIRRDKVKNDVRYAVVDYLQLVEPLMRKNGSREQEVADISTRLKRLALELDIPIIVMTQLNRQGQTRESDRIIHDADVGLMITQDEEQPEYAGTPKGVNVTVTLEKARNGERGVEFPLRFIGEYQSFEQRVEEDPSPEPPPPSRWNRQTTGNGSYHYNVSGDD